LLYLQVRNDQNRSENARDSKKVQVRSDDDIFLIATKCTNFEVSSFGLELQVSSLGVFDEVSVSSQNFNQVSVFISKVTVSTTSLKAVLSFINEIMFCQIRVYSVIKKFFK